MSAYMELDDFSVREASALQLDVAADAIGSLPEQLSEHPHTREAFQPRSGLGGRELYSKEQWEIQKPVIKQLYNLENKPFNRVIDILRTEHKFFPMRRQFYRKIGEWGFEKNIKDKDMRAVVQLLNDKKIQGDNLNVELRGQKVDPAKIQRWQKRHGKAAIVARHFQSNPYNAALIQETFSATVEEESLQENDEFPTLTLNSDTAELSQSIDDSKRQTSDHLSIVDIPGSPLLTRLFKALKIEWEDSIPGLDLTCSSPAAALISPAKAESAESAEEVMEDVNSEVWVDFSLGAASKELVKYSQEMFHSPDKLLTSSDCNQEVLSFSEWSLREWDFARGQPFKMDISHLYGISPYPTPTGIGQYKSAVSGNRSLYTTSLQLHDQENRIRVRVRKLKRTLGAEDPETLLAMLDLGTMYQSQENFKKAERMFRQVANCFSRIYGMEHRATLTAYMNVVDALLDQSEVLQARRIHRIVHDNAIKLFKHDDILAIRSLRVKALLLYSDGQSVESEELVRQVLQIKMHTLGLKNRNTIDDIRFLGTIFCQVGKRAEGEQLLRIGLQLCNKLEGHFSKDSTRSGLTLSGLLLEHGRYDECRELATALVEGLGGSTGQDTPDILSGLFDLALCARGQGQLLDSEYQLRIILERRIRCIGKRHPDTLRTMVELSSVLRNMERYTEATNFLEMSYEGMSKLYGLKDIETLWCCRFLAENYVDLGRWDDAVAALQHSIDHAREPGESPTFTLLSTITKLADIFWKQSRYGEAIPLYKECYDTFVRMYSISPTDSYLIFALRRLCLCYEKLELYGDAASILQRNFEDAMDFGEKRSLVLLENIVDLAAFLLKAGQYMKAMAYYEECLNGFPDVQISNQDCKRVYVGLAVCYKELG